MSYIYDLGKIKKIFFSSHIKIRGSVESLKNNLKLLKIFIVHNIYFHEKNLKSKEELILYINNECENIEIEDGGS